MIEIKEPKTIHIERAGYGYADFEKYDLTNEELIGQFDFSHAKYKTIIKEICDSWSPATNSDFFLWIEVLRCLNLIEVTSGSENFVFKIPRNKLKYIVSSESVRRARQSLNAKGECLPTSEIVRERRLKREATLRRYFGKEKTK